MQGDAAQNLAYALTNVSCPVNTGYIQLFDYNNISSVLPSSNNIITTLKDSTTYLKSSGVVASSYETDILRRPIDDVPYEFVQWVAELVSNKEVIINQKIASSLLDGLTQQRDLAQTFIDTVISKLDEGQHSDAQMVLSPVMGNLNCALGAFKPGSLITICPPSASTTSGNAQTAVEISSTSETVTGNNPTSTSGSSGSSATTEGAASSTSEDSAAQSAGISGMTLFYGCVVNLLAAAII